MHASLIISRLIETRECSVRTAKKPPWSNIIFGRDLGLRYGGEKRMDWFRMFIDHLQGWSKTGVDRLSI